MRGVADPPATFFHEAAEVRALEGWSMHFNRGRCDWKRLIFLSGLLLLTACTRQTPAASAGSPTATVSTTSSTPRVSTGSSVLATYVGHWVSHDDALTIAANGTGVETWNAGPCVGPGTSGMCAGNGNLTFTANADGSLTGAYQSVSYTSSGGTLPASYQPPSGYPVAGNTLSLTHSGTHLLAAMLNGSSFNYCDPTALSQGQCGA